MNPCDIEIVRKNEFSIDALITLNYFLPTEIKKIVFMYIFIENYSGEYVRSIMCKKKKNEQYYDIYTNTNNDDIIVILENQISGSNVSDFVIIMMQNINNGTYYVKTGKIRIEKVHSIDRTKVLKVFRNEIYILGPEWIAKDVLALYFNVYDLKHGHLLTKFFLKTGDSMRACQNHNTVSCIRDYNFYVSGDHTYIILIKRCDNMICLFDTENGEIVRHLTLHGDYVAHIQECHIVHATTFHDKIYVLATSRGNLGLRYFVHVFDEYQQIDLLRINFYGDAKSSITRTISYISNFDVKVDGIYIVNYEFDTMKPTFIGRIYYNTIIVYDFDGYCIYRHTFNTTHDPTNTLVYMNNKTVALHDKNFVCIGHNDENRIDLLK